MNKVIITQYEGFVFVGLFEDGKITDMGLFDPGKEAIGTVYLCDIKDRLPNIDACFVNYSDGKKGFLKSSEFKNGDRVALQLKNESVGNKEPIFSDKIELASNNLIAKKGKGIIKVSAKLEDKLKQHFIENLSKPAAENKLDIIVRTSAKDQPDEVILHELNELIDTFVDIDFKAETRTVHSILYRPLDEYISYAIELLKIGADEVITDIFEIYEFLSDESKAPFGKYDVTVSFYQDGSVPLSLLYKIGYTVNCALDRKVLLKSGAELVFDKTEAMTVVDLNTAHCLKGRNSEETFLKINIEAGKELMRQLKLRNISGMVIVDFINMRSKDSYKALMDEIRMRASEDTVKIDNISFSKLMLLEMTRQKKRLPLAELMRCKNG